MILVGMKRGVYRGMKDINNYKTKQMFLRTYFNDIYMSEVGSAEERKTSNTTKAVALHTYFDDICRSGGVCGGMEGI